MCWVVNETRLKCLIIILSKSQKQLRIENPNVFNVLDSDGYSKIIISYIFVLVEFISIKNNVITIAHMGIRVSVQLTYALKKFRCHF